ncbi:MAG TPA: M28 family metallopeptidase [Candidatus Aquilonibacter sp.]|jgi:N-acetylated-alpha-linked acidic dipeptidase|nr:M28 family metallopeptidase [Candidatus Aquilonibacter sp.]
MQIMSFPRHWLLSANLLCLAALAHAPLSAQSQPSILGFTPSSAAREAGIESKFKSIPSPEEEQRQHRIFTAEPHVAGSARNNELARYIADQWRTEGLEDVVIRRYDVYGSNPKFTSLEMIAPTHYRALLREMPIPGDAGSKNKSISSAWSGMSASGEVTAPLVYAHSGNPEDYDLLRKQGIDVKGKVVLVRYSNPYSYRGFKALTAQREGAAAILIYSDPAEDGYKKGKVDPAGPWGPEYHIQRGAITYDFMVPGDPLTPGWASIPGAKRIPVEEAVSIPKIMALPLSWHDAKPLLAAMDGPIAPDDWQGALPLKYRLGGNRVRVHVKIEMDNSTQPYYVVEGRIRGAELPDDWIVLGNHRDAWVFGAVDPSSGTASLMELTRALGAMKKQGMRPRRTLVFCSWDGEEVGLTGSTEWGEQFADELRSKAVAYINVDEATSGPDFHGQAVASLAPMLVEATHTLHDPSGKSLYEAWKESTARERREAKESEQVTDLNLADTRIGSGSDHTVFLNFIGMPVFNLGFVGPYGVYHSAYDDFFWMNHFGDPGYRYHVLMSQLWGVLALRLANADLLPFDFASYANNIRQFVNTLDKNNTVILSGAVVPRSGAAAQSKDPCPTCEPSGSTATTLDLGAIRSAITDFESAGQHLNGSIARALTSGAIDPKQAAAINEGTMQVERNWLNPDGIPGRPWFKHILYGARFTYAHLELPGLTEAVEKQDWPTANQQAEILRQALEKNTALINELTAKLARP